MQARELPSILEWLQDEILNIRASVDWDHVAVIGHSRGGDIAFHQRSTFAFVDAAVLIDPVMGHTRDANDGDGRKFMMIGMPRPVLLFSI